MYDNINATYFENEASQSHLSYDVSWVRTGNIIFGCVSYRACARGI